jgi:2OG-Fe(II) oxygenase superfamily
MIKLAITNDIYTSTQPFPYYYQDNSLEDTFATALQEEIFHIPSENWDRYQNCFELKDTLRDKFSFPPLLQQLFDYFTCTEFVQELSSIVGYNLVLDETRNFWGVHKYHPGDKLDIHVDAGFHPTNGLKKIVTLGLYLSSKSYDMETNKCALELWHGDSVTKKDCKLHYKVADVAPLFNRLVIFTCNDVSWHGNPEPLTSSGENEIDTTCRIFITISYLTEDETNCENKYVKAYFIARPDDPIDPKKDEMRRKRVDPVLYKTMYKT